MAREARRREERRGRPEGSRRGTAQPLPGSRTGCEDNRVTSANRRRDLVDSRVLEITDPRIYARSTQAVSVSWVANHSDDIVAEIDEQTRESDPHLPVCSSDCNSHRTRLTRRRGRSSVALFCDPGSRERRPRRGVAIAIAPGQAEAVGAVGEDMNGVRNPVAARDAARR